MCYHLTYHTRSAWFDIHNATDIDIIIDIDDDVDTDADMIQWIPKVINCLIEEGSNGS